MMTSATIEAATRVRAPRMAPTIIAVIWELRVTAPPSPPLVDMGVLVLELVLVDTAPDCDVVGVGTKVSIGEEDGEGGV